MPFSETWPRAGVPDKPGAWLLTAARRRLNDRARHARGHTETTLRLNAVNLWCYKRGLMTDVVLQIQEYSASTQLQPFLGIL